MDLTFTATVFEWRGPAPHHFVAVPAAEAAALASVARAVTYGWGMIPVAVTVDGYATTTALWPRDGGYVVPLKADLRRARGIEVGDAIEVTLTVAV